MHAAPVNAPSTPAARIPTKRYALRRTAEVLLIGLEERLRRPPALAPGDVPRSPEEISPAWLAAVLSRGGPAPRLTAIRVVGGSGGTTTRAALELAWESPHAAASAGLPTRVFVKCTSGLAQRLMLGLGGLIHGEPGFYMHVRPGLEIEAPVGYFGAVEPRSWRSVVVTEDVAATRGARFWTPGDTIGREQMEELLANVARWHGALWDSPRLAQWNWLKTPGEQMRLIDALIGMANRLPAGVARARAVIPPGLRGRQAAIFAGMRRSMERLSRGALTYLHGDLHVANTYLTSAGRIGVADWQVGLRGGWAHDVAYAMATALRVEDRRAWERDLLQGYLERLAEAGGERIDLARAWEAYRAATFYPYFAWIYTIGRSRLQPSFQPETVSLTMVERTAAAIEDLGSLRAVGL